MGKSRIVRVAMLATISAGAVGQGASAETLAEALAKAYRDNPTLNAARASQRATDEQVPLQRARGLPVASANGNYTHTLEPSNVLTSSRDQLAVEGNVRVPIYSGGTVRNAVNAAKQRVVAGQNDLRGTEMSIFSQVVAAYMDVIRDGAVVGLNEQNVRALEVNLQASKDRFEVGDLTRTDVAQSESRLALARANLQQTKAQLISSKENYAALVGTAPIDLQPPPAPPGLPESPETAVAVALADNPDIKAAVGARDAARFDTRSAEGLVAPNVSGFVNGSLAHSYGSFGSNAFIGLRDVGGASVGATVTVPIYQGGQPGAQQRQAVALEAAAIERSIETERQVIAQTRASYASWQASLLTIQSTERAVSAAELSLEGVKAENSVGTRTILDILNAEQEALNARVQLVSARRNAYVAAFSLLAAMGHAQARDLNLDGGALYDPVANSRQVGGKWFDFDFRPAPQPVSGRTNLIPPQTDAPVGPLTP